MTIGIFGAEKTEIELLEEILTDCRKIERAGLTFFCGTLHGISVVAVCGGIGKVNAALCCQLLISEFHAEAIINTGTAGGLLDSLNIFDIVVSSDSVQHDVDASAFGYEPGCVPMTKSAYIEADSALKAAAIKAFGLLKNDSGDKLKAGIKLIEGRIASGDTFVSTEHERKRIIDTFHPACVEMEGAAVAQVCSVNKVPHIILRSISDTAGKTGAAKISYEQFAKEAAHTSSRLVAAMFEVIKNN